MTEPLPIILIPGLLCNEWLWQAQLKVLQPITKVTVADIITHDNLALLAKAILKSAPEKFCLAGFSLGGWIAIKIMEYAPERVAKIALLSCTRGGLTPFVQQALQTQIELLKQGELDKYLTESFPTYFADANNNKLREIFFKMAHSVGAEAGIKQIGILLKQLEIFQCLANIKCPALVIGGTEDKRVTSEVIKQLAERIPSAKCAFVKNAAHFTPLEQPEEINRLLLDWYHNG